MRILFISFSFPPYNAIGSVRAAQLALFLEKHGHEVRIVAGDQLGYPKTMDLPPLKARIFRARYRDLEAPLNWARRILGARPSANATADTATKKIWMVALVNLYRTFIAIPDGQAGWYPAAMRAAKQALKDWTPDVIVSTALPFTSHVVASRVSCRTGKPWVAEYRDLFAGNPYSDLPKWRTVLDRLIERLVIARSSALVAVTPQIANELAQVHGVPTHVFMNGYDDAEVSVDDAPPVAIGRPLQILYTGIIYPGRRDPSPLFAAIRLMGELGSRVRVSFYGQDLRGVQAAAVANGIADQITICDPVSHQESLRLQRQADILLLLLWDDPRERGTITGKLFEYIGAGRPILATGCVDGIASSLVRERKLGLSAADPAAIAEILKRWIAEIDRTGTVSPPLASGREGLRREEQLASYEALLRNLAP